MAKKMRITDSKCLAMHLSIQHIEEVLDEKVRLDENELLIKASKIINNLVE
jgi:hypothetical protein